MFKKKLNSSKGQINQFMYKIKKSLTSSLCNRFTQRMMSLDDQINDNFSEKYKVIFFNNCFFIELNKLAK